MENSQNTPDPARAFDTDPDDGIQATSHAPVNFRYYEYVMAAFVAILLLSNIIGAAKQSVVSVPFWPANKKRSKNSSATCKPYVRPDQAGMPKLWETVAAEWQKTPQPSVDQQNGQFLGDASQWAPMPFSC